MLTPCAVPKVENGNLGLTKVEFFTFSQWKQGVDVEKTLEPRTFRRHRKAIMEKTGFDIRLMAPLGVLDDMNVAVITIKPLEEVPSWYSLPKPKSSGG
jgi:hypothetical protein